MADKKNTHPASESTALQSRAESILKPQPFLSKDPLNLSNQELQNLIYELRVHQIELELQNQELSKTQHELVELRDYYFETYNYAPVGYLTVNKKGTILQANLTIAKFLQFDKAFLIGKRLPSYIAPEDQDKYYLNINQVARDLTERTFDITLTGREGARFSTRIECIPAKNQDGNFSEFRLVISDIGDLIQIRTGLEKSLRQLDLSLDAANAGMWEWDLRTNANSWSNKLWDLYGLVINSCEPCYAEWLNTIHPDDRAMAERTVQDAVSHGSELNLEWRVNTAKETTRWLMCRGKPVHDSSGSMSSYIGIVIDITDRKQSEQHLEKLVNQRTAQLRESEEAFRLIFENCMDGIMVNLADGTILKANPSACEILGRPEADICRIGRSGIVNEHDPRFSQMLEARNKDGYVRGELTYKLKDGTLSAVEVTSKLFSTSDQQTKTVVCFRDISERLRMENELRDREARFRSYFDLPLVGIAMTSPTKDWLEVNDYLCDMLGYSRQELIQTTWAALTHPDDLKEDTTKFEHMLAGEIDNYSMGKRFIRKDGSTVWTQLSRGCVRKFNGTVDYVVALFQNIDQRKQLEKSLTDGKRQWETTFDTVPDVIAIIDDEHRIVRTNKALTDKLGIGAEDCVGRKYYELIYGTDSPPVRSPHSRLMIDGKGHSSEIYLDSLHGYYLITASPLIDEDGGVTCSVIVARDVTDLRKTQDALAVALKKVSSQKLDVEKNLQLRSSELFNSESRFQMLFETAQDYIFIKDADLRYVDINPAALELLQMKAQDIVGKSDRELFGDKVAGLRENIEQRVLRGQVVESRENFSWNQLKIELGFVRSPLKGSNDKVQGVFAIAREIIRPPCASGDPSMFTRDYQSPAMGSTLERINLAALTDTTVLLTGETGSGKDYLARVIHEASNRAAGSYHSINCAAIPQELAESELFGHEAGAFTGAIRRKRGLFELAEGGTLLLNEIAELSLGMQSKLLLFLDTLSFSRLGGERTIAVNVRLIAATNKDLWTEVSEGRFRKDLFYRLNVYPIHVPPLRERLNDLPVMVENILRQLAAELILPKVPRIGQHVIEMFQNYDWPGNIRELKNVLERAVIVSRGRMISREHFELKLGTGTGDSILLATPERKSRREIIDSVERPAIEDALLRAGGKKARAARLLRMSRSTLRRRMVKLGIAGADAPDQN
jgi:sigma-54 dependent transcriptional regulator, acetoin dehydrogenase operon transcriptional activator AcoR